MSKFAGSTDSLFGGNADSHIPVASLRIPIDLVSDPESEELCEPKARPTFLARPTPVVVIQRATSMIRARAAARPEVHDGPAMERFELAVDGIFNATMELLGAVTALFGPEAQAEEEADDEGDDDNDENDPSSESEEPHTSDNEFIDDDDEVFQYAQGDETWEEESDTADDYAEGSADELCYE